MLFNRSVAIADRMRLYRATWRLPDPALPQPANYVAGWVSKDGM